MRVHIVIYGTGGAHEELALAPDLCTAMRRIIAEKVEIDEDAIDCAVPSDALAVHHVRVVINVTIYGAQKQMKNVDLLNELAREARRIVCASRNARRAKPISTPVRVVLRHRHPDEHADRNE